MKKITLFAALAIATASFAQTNPIKLTKGQKFAVYTVVDATSTIEVMGQSMENKAYTETTELYDVESADGKNYVVEQKMKKMTMKAESMGQETNFDSEEAGSRESEIGKALGPLMDAKYKLTMNSNGEFTAVESKDVPVEDNTGMLQMMGMSSNNFAVGNRFTLAVLPNTEIKVGSTWEDDALFNRVLTTRKFTVTGITGNDVMIDFTSSSDMNITQEIMGQQAEIKGKNTGTGKMTVDKITGLVKESNGTVSTDATVAVQGMEIPTKSTSKVAINVRPE